MKKQKTEVIKFRLGITEKENLQEIADREQRTLAGQIRIALHEWIKKARGAR